MPEFVNAKMKSISSAIILYFICILVLSSQMNNQCDFSFYSLCASAQRSDAEEQKMAKVVAVLHMDQLGNKPLPPHGPQIEVLVVNGGNFAWCGASWSSNRSAVLREIIYSNSRWATYKELCKWVGVSSFCHVSHLHCIPIKLWRITL